MPKVAPDPEQGVTPHHLTLDEVHDLAPSLVVELAEVMAEPDEVDAVLRDWVADLGPRAFGLVSSWALRTVFAECLRHVPLDQVPASAVAFTDPEEKP